MARYETKFLLETPLIADKDVSFIYRDDRVELLFSERFDNHRIHIRTSTSAPNWLEAVDNSQKTISPVLDAIALHQKVPLMLQSITQILKAETGANRRAVLIDVQMSTHPVHLNALAIEEIRRALAADPQLSRGTTRWLRFYFQPVTILERFLYSWLAFEDLAGTQKITTTCPHCSREVSSRPAINKDEAYALLRASDPQLDNNQFNKLFKSWWSGLRSPVLHGGREVTSGIRHQMNEAMDIFVPATEARLQAQAGYKAAYAGRYPNDGYMERQLYHFIEFNSNDDGGFAKDAPTPAQVTSAISRQQEEGFRLLQSGDFEGW